MILLIITASTIHVLYSQFLKSEFSSAFIFSAPAFLSFIFLIPVYVTSETYSYSFLAYLAYLMSVSAICGALTYFHHRRRDVDDLYTELKTKAPIDLKALLLFIFGISALTLCAYLFENNSYSCTKKCKNSPYIMWVEQRFWKQYSMLFITAFMNQVLVFRVLAYVFRNRIRNTVSAAPSNENEGA